MKYYLVPIIIFLLGFLFLYTFFAEILREMGIMGADGGHPRGVECVDFLINGG